MRAGAGDGVQRRGYEVFVVDLERKEWLNVAKGLLTPAFWQSKCTAEQGYRWYMDRVHAKVQEAMGATGAAQVCERKRGPVGSHGRWKRPSNSPHDPMVLRVELVGSHGRWKRPCLQTAHMTICY